MTEKGKFHFLLISYCQENGLELTQEYEFAKPRKFRADYAILSHKVLIEYEGLFSKKSRHTTVKGYSADTEKYNIAAKMGFRVLRYTATTFSQIEADLNDIINE